MIIYLKFTCVNYKQDFIILWEGGKSEEIYQTYR